MQAIEEIASRLPQGIAYDWTGVSYQERMASSQTGILYTFSVLVHLVPQAVQLAISREDAARVLGGDAQIEPGHIFLIFRELGRDGLRIAQGRGDLPGIGAL